MDRIATRLAIFCGVLCGQATAAPPDEVPHAMVPALTRATGASPNDDRQAAAVAALARAASQPGSRIDAQYRQPDATANGGPTDAEREEAARFAVWNSEEMLEARRYVLEVGKRSARSSEREAQAFLNRLSALSAEQMTTWLQRLQAQRRGIAVQRAVEDEAREAQREEALALLREQEAARQSVRQWQGRSAEWLQSRFDVERFLTQERQQGRRAEIASALDAKRLRFNPFYPTLDPMTPPPKIAGAASLPGDLPRSDPRNFIRGEEGIDFGGSGGVGFAGATAPAAAPSPAPTTAPSAAPVAVEGGASGVAEASGGE
ncbi:hypothetical protein [Lacipirellula parvula]|uniref:Uncharacterized protein n=1 Tax=Lacipirellula parvula TaxID=2650471 RepID=A0A5K7XC04_9BACT|nr:hypothetical protein [Lacipirellula parvula]BBO33557.1 hypothetical protein PLANPX_3169 [Lacipirellula parvula]